MLLELDVELDHVVYLVLDKVRENDVCLVTRRERISRSRQQILRLVEVQFRAYTQTERHQRVGKIYDERQAELCK